MQITQGTSAVAFSYDTASRRTSLTLPNGIVMSYSYDNGSQLTGINYTHSSTTIGNLTYSYDLAGRRINAGGTFAGTGLPQAISTTEYDAANELTQWGTATPTYDNNGNILSDGTNSYVWNARNQLVSMNSGGMAFQYDAFGRRVAKTNVAYTTNYLYDGVNPAQELAGATPTANVLAGGLDEYFQRTDSTGTANFLTDALGNTLALTDGSGNTLAQYTYEPFGNTTITGSSSNPYQYTGRENDGTGVYFYRGRYYNPTFQRFISEDPIGMAGSGPNLYAYVGNNPISFRDPFGTDKRGGCQMVCKTALGVAGVAAIALTDGLAAPAVAEAAEAFDAAEAAGAAVEAAEAAEDAGAAEEEFDSVYSARVLNRMAGEPGPFHNFPMTYDNYIIQSGDVGVLDENYIQYELQGSINGTAGTYQIGGNWYEDIFLITHRFFSPL